VLGELRDVSERVGLPPRKARRRPAALIAVVLVAAAVLVGIAIANKDSTPTMSNAVPPIPGVASARELGPIRQLTRVQGRDNGQSTQYGTESVWIFADTLLRAPWGFLSNSGASTSDLNASNGINLRTATVFGDDGSTPADVLPLTRAELDFEAAHATTTGCNAFLDQYCGARFGFWPGPVVADPLRHRLLVFYNKLCRGGAKNTPCSGSLGKGLGTGVAAIDMSTHRITRLTVANGPKVKSVEGTDPTMFFPPSPGYASAALVVDDDVYVYGDCGGKCHLARAPLASVSDRSEWRFFNGRTSNGTARWAADPVFTVPTIDAGAAGNTVLWVPALHSWLNVFMRYGDNLIDAQVGGSPYGPWSAVFKLHGTTAANKDLPNYAAFGHVEYAQNDGLTQYISYYENSTGAQRLVKVTFEPGH
jgi:hypothetical protein